MDRSTNQKTPDQSHLRGRHRSYGGDRALDARRGPSAARPHQPESRLRPAHLNWKSNDIAQGAGIVESWLANVSRRGIFQPSPGPDDRDQSVSHNLEWRPHGPTRHGSLRQGHKHSRSRDSSIIAETPTFPTGKRGCSRQNVSESVEEQYESQPVFGGLVTSDKAPSPNFEKRKRHKTREDRYASTKEPRHRERKIRKEKDSVRKIRPAKTPLASGREVMDNFHSDAILHERLTLQPFILPGLFQNGRISSPKPEELAYNSMASLTRPSSQLQYRQRQNQSRAKERKRREKEADEMMNVFGGKGASTIDHTETSARAPRADQLVDMADLSCSDSFAVDNCPETAHTGLAFRKDTEVPGRHSQSRTSPGLHSASEVRASSRAASYVTWSTSNNFPPSTMHEWDRRGYSITPEPVKEALRQTRVFDGTGIRSNSRAMDTGSYHADEPQFQEVIPPNWNAQARRSSSKIPEKPTIVRYHDKGVMATDYTLLGAADPPRASESTAGGCHLPHTKTSAHLSCSQGHRDPTSSRRETEKAVQTKHDDPVGHASVRPNNDQASRTEIAAQAHIGPQTGLYSKEIGEGELREEQMQGSRRLLEADKRTFVKQPTETERRGPTSEISSTGIQARKSFLSLGDNVAQYWQLDDDMPGDGDHVVRDRVSDYPRYDNHLEGGFFFRNNELARQESGHEICSAHAYENPRGYNKATALPPESIADYISSAEREILGADYDVYIQGGPDYQGSCEQHGEHADVPDVHG